MEKLAVGSVVISKMGRDSGKIFMVTHIIDDNYVKIADGAYHKIDKPKLKKIKHLKYKGEMIETLANKISLNKQIFDGELYKALRSCNGLCE